MYNDDNDEDDKECHSGFILAITVAAVCFYFFMGYLNSNGGGM